jgi:hypothetical protein
VVARQEITRPQAGANAHGDRFLTGVWVHPALDSPLLVQLSGGLLEKPDFVHLAQQGQELVSFVGVIWVCIHLLSV